MVSQRFEFKLEARFTLPAVDSDSKGHITAFRYGLLIPPAPGDGASLSLVLSKGERQMATTETPRFDNPAVSGPKQRCFVADTKRLETLQLVPEVPVDLLESKQGFWLNRQSFSCTGDPELCQSIQLLMQGADLVSVHCETTGSGMAPVAI